MPEETGFKYSRVRVNDQNKIISECPCPELRKCAIARKTKNVFFQTLFYRPLMLFSFRTNQNAICVDPRNFFLLIYFYFVEKKIAAK